MNLLFCISFERWGGVHTWMLELGEALQEHGHKVCLSALKGHHSLERARQLGLDTRNIPYGPDFCVSPTWVGFLRKRKIDAIVANTSKEIRTVGVAARLLGIPVIQWAGLAKDLCRNTITTRFERRYIVRRFVVACQSMRTDILREYSHIDGNKIEVIYPGKRHHKNSRTKSVLKEELGLKASAIHGVICSQLTKGKGHMDLLKALTQLKQDGTLSKHSFHLSIYHDGAMQQELGAAITEMQLQDRVVMRGFNNQIVQLLPAFDLGLLPSHWEGFANNLVDYMLAGLCPIVSNISGNTELVTHQINGLIHPTGDATAIAERVREALADLDMTRQYGQEAQRHAEKICCRTRATREWEMLIERELNT